MQTVSYDHYPITIHRCGTANREARIVGPNPRYDWSGCASVLEASASVHYPPLSTSPTLEPLDADVHFETPTEQGADRNRAPICSTAIALWVAMVGIVLGFGPAAADAASLEDAGTPPPDPLGETILEQVCALDEADELCSCREKNDGAAEVTRIRHGHFSGEDSEQMLAAIRGCEAGSALLELRDGEPERALRYYPEVETDICSSFPTGDGTDVLVCHRTVEGSSWRIGFFHSLDFRGAELVRRQITSYRSNARGCPENRLRTTHATGWRRWAVEGDPRPPMLMIHFQLRNGEVPAQHANACEAMGEGEPVFGPLRRRTEYYTLEGRRFRRVGARTATGREGDIEWVDERRPEEPACRREDALDRVRRHRDEVTHCYTRALKKNRSLAGKLRLEWSVDEEGRVDGVRAVRDELEDEALVECVGSVIRTFEFPPPRAAASCSFVHTFEFAFPSDDKTDPQSTRHD